MKKRLKYLITGGTGFLGQFVVQILETEADIDVLSRSGKTGVKGDLSRWQGGIDLESLQDKNYDVMIHLAGLYDLEASEADVHMNNVAGTNAALQIANALQIPVFINASSIAAAANLKSVVVGPDDLNLTEPFPDHYSKSKALAEQLVHNWSGPIRMRLNLRLGILVGDSQEGKIVRLDGPYSVVKSLDKVKNLLMDWSFPLPVPGNPRVHLPFVPVNQCAAAIVNLSKWAIESKESGYRSLNLVPQSGVSVDQLYHSVFKHLGLEHIKLKFMNNITQGLLTKLGSFLINLPEEQIRYASKLPQYDSHATREILGNSWCSEFSDYEEVFWRGYENYLSNS